MRAPSRRCTKPSGRSTGSRGPLLTQLTTGRGLPRPVVSCVNKGPRDPVDLPLGLVQRLDGALIPLPVDPHRPDVVAGIQPGTLAAVRDLLDDIRRVGRDLPADAGDLHQPGTAGVAVTREIRVPTATQPLGHLIQ